MARHRARPLQRLRYRLRLPRSIGETITSLPYGDGQSTLGSCGDESPMHFTGKMRDAESNLDAPFASRMGWRDDFDARYYSSQWGRFMIPDWDAKPAAVPYAKFGNPQSLDLYSYTQNNPTTLTDQDGHACSTLNSGSDFCQRAVEYTEIDNDTRVRSQTRFFAAASATSQALADVDIPKAGRLAASSETQSFLRTMGQDLEKMNQVLAGGIQIGTLSGSGLDAKMVHMEQTQVQKKLDDLKAADPAAYSKVIGEINKMLNPTGVNKFLGNRQGTDSAYGKVLDEVRQSLGGRPIDFSNQEDREKIGNALISHIESTGGADVTANTYNPNG